jgi:acetyl esterase/lipase
LKAPKYATGSTRPASPACCSNIAYPTPGLIPSQPRRCRTRSAPWVWSGSTPPSGASIQIVSAAISNLYEKRLYDPIDDADKLSCRPDFSVVVYPGYLALPDQNFAPNADIHPTANTPPTFIVQAEDDPVHVENAVVYFMQLKNAKVPAELHVYAQGGHGYGLRRTELPVTSWPQEVEKWLHTIGILPPGVE